ncbi:MAG: type secretion protein DotN [Gammaproteobacteria bacterium]|nr:type secretion protein DotN [Gammaproteobacteria bacterium]
MTQPSPKAPAVVALPTAAVLAARRASQPVLGVKRRLWRKDDDHAFLADKAFAPVRDQVLKRDNHSCRFCGFRSPKFQEVHHWDDDHTNNEVGNLMTVCNLCHQVHHLGMCGMRGAGFIAALPELTQTEVNHIARAHFVALVLVDTNTKDRLIGLYALLRARADMLKSAFHLDIASPLLFAEILSGCDERMYAARATFLESLRLVATEAAFQAGQVDYYAINHRTQFAPEHWSALAAQLQR